MEFISSFLSGPWDFLTIYILPFVIVLSILVFVHEWGHFTVARFCGVKVSTFSIGFGKEIFGFTDKKGTRWKFSWIPLGGYVQMFGDVDAASTTHSEEIQEEGEEAPRPISEEEKKVAFFAQPIAIRSAIIFAGPAVNFLFAIILLTGMFAIQGQPYTPPVVSKLVADSPAEKSGIQVDDKIVSMNGQKITRFEDMALFVAINLDKSIEIKLAHYLGDKKWDEMNLRTINVRPELIELEDRFGFKSQRGRLGIVSLAKSFESQKHTLGSAFIAANLEVWDMSVNTLQAVGQMIIGTREANELGGIIRIGAYAGDFAKEGIAALIMFMAMLSVNLGLINLFPIPLLDGGHLAFYALESIKGKPLGERFQEYALRTGLALIMSLMIFSTWNDLVQLRVIDYIKNLVS